MPMLMIDREVLSAAHKRQASLKLLRTIAQIALKDEFKLKNPCVELNFVSDKAIQKLNYRYRNKNKPTDVLSFPLLDVFRGRIRETLLPGTLLLGSVVIARETALRQAAEFGHSFRAEVLRLFVHGLCHLMGYDHELGAYDERIMFKKEDAIIHLVKTKLAWPDE